MTAPRGITQPPTSFIGSQCQGIHHAPLNTYNTKPKNESYRKIALTNKHPHQTPTTPAPRKEPAHARPASMFRCSQPLSTNQTPHPTTKAGRQPIPISGFPHSGRRDSGLVASKPNSVSDDPITGVSPPAQCLLLHQTPTHYRRRAIQRIAAISELPHSWAGRSLVVLLRKEEIQPHLPVRLPCYDFVPIASPTFDGSLPYGLGHRLRVLPTFVT